MIELRSYRRVFELERRIYSVDQLRLNPGGIPVRGIVYFLVLLAGSLLLGCLPLRGALAARLPWYLRDILLPAGAATALAALRLEGRPFHLAAHALVRYCVEPRTLAGGRPCRGVGRRWHPPELVLIPDGSDCRMRRLRYAGPGAVLVTVQHERGGRAVERGGGGLARPGVRSGLTLTPSSPARALQPAQVIFVGERARVLVRGGAAGRGRA
ncbi:MAG TPA: hypothetical protein VKV16_11700 [Solirubrobacteraceae bacterium]|nr:hypothetical protein [Solirubrobacteraceae bacterium]